MIIRKREIVKENNKFYNTLDIYKNQLAHMLKDCKGIDAKIQYLRYERNAMIKLFQYYYQCIGIEITYEEVNEKPKWKWGLTVGSSFDKLKFSSKETVFRPITNANLKAVGFQGGLSAEFIPIKNLQRWSSNLELVYHAFNPKDGTVSFDFSYINLNILPRYYFGKENKRPFITAGFSYGQALKSKGILNPGNPEHNELNNWRMAVLGGAGLNIGRIDVETRYELASAITSITSVDSSVRSIYLSLTYRFNNP